MNSEFAFGSDNVGLNTVDKFTKLGRIGFGDRNSGALGTIFIFSCL